MKYSVYWRNLKAGGFEEWQRFDDGLDRKHMLSSRKYLLGLSHEVKVVLGDTEIEVENDDK